MTQENDCIFYQRIASSFLENEICRYNPNVLVNPYAQSSVIADESTVAKAECKSDENENIQENVTANFSSSASKPFAEVQQNNQLYPYNRNNQMIGHQPSFYSNFAGSEINESYPLFNYQMVEPQSPFYPKFAEHKVNEQYPPCRSYPIWQHPSSGLLYRAMETGTVEKQISLTQSKRESVRPKRDRKASSVVQPNWHLSDKPKSNIYQRKRMKRVNEALELLKSCIPYEMQRYCKMTKASILRLAILYIEQLTAQIRKLDEFQTQY